MKRAPSQLSIARAGRGGNIGQRHVEWYWQLAFYEPDRPANLPIVFGRRYTNRPADQARMRAALRRFNDAFGADPNCTAIVEAFEVAYVRKGGDA